VTYADEWQARHLLNRRIPGGIYRGSNWLCEGRCTERLAWIDHETGVQVSRSSDGMTFTHDQMRARGCVPAGRFALWRFTYDPTIPAREQARRAHAMRHALPAIVLQLPLEAAEREAAEREAAESACASALRGVARPRAAPVCNRTWWNAPHQGAGSYGLVRSDWKRLAYREPTLALSSPPGRTC
jgi:hypothetical protein